MQITEHFEALQFADTRNNERLTCVQNAVSVAVITCKPSNFGFTYAYYVNKSHDTAAQVTHNEMDRILIYSRNFLSKNKGNKFNKLALWDPAQMMEVSIFFGLPYFSDAYSLRNTESSEFYKDYFVF